MKIISRRKILKDHLTLGIKRYLTINCVFLLLLVLVRIYEYFFLRYTITLPPDSIGLSFKGIFHDILILLNLSAWLIGPFLLLFIISKRLTEIVTGFLIFVFIAGEIALIQYFSATSLLLGIDLFGYSLKEIMEIATAGGGFSFTALVPVLVLILLTIVLFRLSGQLKIHVYGALAFLALSLLSLSFSKYTLPDPGKYSSEAATNLVTNKAYHLISVTRSFYYPDEATEAVLFNYFYTGTDVAGKSFDYVSAEYPFLRKDDTPDILGKYFNPPSGKPNLVFIIVESLGRAYSGNGAYLGSFTPFLDSLENHSLYWENALSTAGRTFEVLPSVFGSMPYGKSGFAELGSAMPDGMSLISLLKERGYASRFFYGGDADFDNMKMFLNREHLDQVTDQNDFGPGYHKMPSNTGGFTWGYGEKDIFKKSFEVLAHAGTEPRLDIYLTLAMHDPYRIPDQAYYNQKVGERLNQLNLNESQKNEYRKYLPNYASVLYFDDALKAFFDEYRKRADYSNTIFIITGDHRMSSPPISTQIDRFHVPLIIYSPMLSTPQKFSSVVSHLDITPTVVAFLKKNYGMNFPSHVPWLGQGLDSLTTFRNTRSVPFIRTKNEIIDYLDRDYFIVNNQLFRVSANMALDKVEDSKVLTEIQRKFEQFKSDNLKATLNNRLIPDSLKFRLKE